jgi:hypothetical protein
MACFLGGAADVLGLILYRYLTADDGVSDIHVYGGDRRFVGPEWLVKQRVSAGHCV